MGNGGHIAETRCDRGETSQLHRESLAIMREIGDRQGEAYSLNNLGNIAQTRGDEDAGQMYTGVTNDNKGGNY